MLHSFFFSLLFCYKICTPSHLYHNDDDDDGDDDDDDHDDDDDVDVLDVDVDDVGRKV